jgi:Ion channel
MGSSATDQPLKDEKVPENGVRSAISGEDRDQHSNGDVDATEAEGHALLNGRSDHHTEMSDGGMNSISASDADSGDHEEDFNDTDHDQHLRLYYQQILPYGVPLFYPTGMALDRASSDFLSEPSLSTHPDQPDESSSVERQGEGLNRDNTSWLLPPPYGQYPTEVDLYGDKDNARQQQRLSSVPIPMPITSRQRSSSTSMQGHYSSMQNNHPPSSPGNTSISSWETSISQKRRIVQVIVQTPHEQQQHEEWERRQQHRRQPLVRAASDGSADPPSNSSPSSYVLMPPPPPLPLHHQQPGVSATGRVYSSGSYSLSSSMPSSSPRLTLHNMPPLPPQQSSMSRLSSISTFAEDNAFDGDEHDEGTNDADGATSRRLSAQDGSVTSLSWSIRSPSTTAGGTPTTRDLLRPLSLPIHSFENSETNERQPLETSGQGTRSNDRAQHGLAMDSSNRSVEMTLSDTEDEGGDDNDGEDPNDSALTNSDHEEKQSAPLTRLRPTVSALASRPRTLNHQQRRRSAPAIPTPSALGIANGEPVGVPTTSISDGSQPRVNHGHRRSRSGDAAAATLLPGGAGWKGMTMHRIPLPSELAAADEEEEDEEALRSSHPQRRLPKKPASTLSNPAGIDNRRVRPPSKSTARRDSGSDGNASTDPGYPMINATPPLSWGFPPYGAPVSVPGMSNAPTVFLPPPYPPSPGFSPYLGYGMHTPYAAERKHFSDQQFFASPPDSGGQTGDQARRRMDEIRTFAAQAAVGSPTLSRRTTPPTPPGKGPFLPPRPPMLPHVSGGNLPRDGRQHARESAGTSVGRLETVSTSDAILDQHQQDIFASLSDDSKIYYTSSESEHEDQLERMAKEESIRLPLLRQDLQLDNNEERGSLRQSLRMGPGSRTDRRALFANIGKRISQKANLARFLPHKSILDDDPQKHPTFTCPRCKTRQRAFFSVGDAPQQFETTSGYLAFYFAFYVVASLFIFGLEEGWAPLDCVYFAVITLTTTGLGDFVPSTDVDKIICSVFIYFGVACIGLLLGKSHRGSPSLSDTLDP